MNFYEIANLRQSCRNYDPAGEVSEEKLQKILDTAILSPSACNSQPYHITVARGENAKKVAKATQGVGINGFTDNVPVMLVISEKEYNSTANIGSKLKKNDYRSIDIGILAAYITAKATEEGIDSCILGWFDNKKLKEICSLTNDVRIVIALGIKHPDDKLRTKKRKDKNVIVSWL